MPQSAKALAHKIKVQTKTLNKQQQDFFDNWITTGNATQSAKDAGYSKKSADSIGSALLKNPLIKKAITEYHADRVIPGVIEKNWIIDELKLCYRKFLRQKNPASAVRCLEQLMKLGGFDDSGKNPPGKNGDAENPGKGKYDDFTIDELRAEVQRRDERLAHANTSTG